MFYRTLVLCVAFLSIAMINGPPAVAQEKRPAAPARSEVERNDARTREKLSQPIPAEFIETPLRNVLDFLGDLLEVEFYVDWKKLEQVKVSADAPITLNLARVRASMALDLILDQADGDRLAYVIRDGVVIVSTVDDLEGAAMMRVYNVRDLLAKADAGGAASPSGYPAMSGAEAFGPYGGAGGLGPGPRAPGGSFSGGEGMYSGGEAESIPPPVSSPAGARLVTILTSSVAPSSWQTRGGTGTIGEYNGLIVVNHNARVHAQVEQVLKMLRQAAATGDKPTVVGEQQ